MRVLLDTHVLLWSVTNDARLTMSARQIIEDAEVVYVSMASLWEIAIKQSVGKLSAAVSVAELCRVMAQDGYELLPIKAEHIVHLTTLPPLHRDPFDRMLVAQSLAEPLHLMTRDAEMMRYGAAVICA